MIIPGVTNPAGVIGQGAGPATGGLPRGAINTTHQLIFATTGVPVPAQWIKVPQGSSVYIRASNGTTVGNVAGVRVAISRELLSTANGGDFIANNTEIYYPVDNTGQIWAVGTAADGVAIAIRANAT